MGIDEEGLEDFRPLGEEAYFAVLDEDKKRAICGDENVREITDDSYAVIIDEPKPYPEDPTEGVGWGLALLSAAGTDIEEPYSYEHMVRSHLERYDSRLLGLEQVSGYKYGTADCVDSPIERCRQRRRHLHHRHWHQQFARV